MDFESYVDALRRTGVIPVIKLENEEDAVPLANALREGGIYAAEVTFRAAGAEKVIAAMAGAFPDMLIGAGTVLTEEQVDKAVGAGAKFCVAPGLNPKVAEHCLAAGVPFTPGVSSGSEIERALGLGLDFVKFFPAEQAGGLPYIKAVSAPYSSVRFMPTGGVNENNLRDYLSFGKVVCCGGSWIVPDKLVKAKNWSSVTALCRAAVDKMLDFSLAHVGVNCESGDEAAAGADFFARAFGFPADDRGASVFAGGAAEFMKTPHAGRNGHIAIGTSSLERAVFQLEKRGYSVDESTWKTDESGRKTAVYLKDEACGFAVHLVQK